MDGSTRYSGFAPVGSLPHDLPIAQFVSSPPGLPLEPSLKRTAKAPGNTGFLDEFPGLGLTGLLPGA